MSKFQQISISMAKKYVIVMIFYGIGAVALILFLWFGWLTAYAWLAALMGLFSWLFAWAFTGADNNEHSEEGTPPTLRDYLMLAGVALGAAVLAPLVWIAGVAAHMFLKYSERSSVKKI